MLTLLSGTPKYTEDLKKTILALYQGGGKTFKQITDEYEVSKSELSNWIRQYSVVKADDGSLISAKKIKLLQKRNAKLEEENMKLKNAIAIFTPHSNKD